MYLNKRRVWYNIKGVMIRRYQFVVRLACMRDSHSSARTTYSDERCWPWTFLIVTYESLHNELLFEVLRGI